MLNTSLHNPNVKLKVRQREREREVRGASIILSIFPQPSVEQFISMNRDINDGKDLPVDMLRVSQLTSWNS